jgi:hypothetical protein
MIVAQASAVSSAATQGLYLTIARSVTGATGTTTAFTNLSNGANMGTLLNVTYAHSMGVGYAATSGVPISATAQVIDGTSLTGTIYYSAWAFNSGISSIATSNVMLSVLQVAP